MESIYNQVFKRVLDIMFSILGLLMLSPIFILSIALLWFTNNRTNVFFTQTRPGRNEKLFKIIKLKTMVDKFDNNGNLLPDIARVTKIGKFMRLASIDELPQLINILKGDMSFVGPRPLLVEYLDLYTDKQRRRHEVRPGLTGWSQVNGRNSISWKTKLEYDLWYVENISWITDLKIILKTLAKVLRIKDVNSGVGITMNKFNGNN